MKTRSYRYFDVSITSVALPKNEVKDVDQSVIEHLLKYGKVYDPTVTVHNDYFDVEGTVEKLLGNVSEDSFNGLTASTGILTAAEFLSIPAQKLVENHYGYNNYIQQEYPLPTKDIDCQARMDFSKNLMEGSRYSAGEHPKINAQAKLKGIRYDVSMRGKADGKGKLFAEALAAALQAKGLQAVPQSKTDAKTNLYRFVNSQGKQIASVQNNGYQVSFTYTFI